MSKPNYTVSKTESGKIYKAKLTEAYARIEWCKKTINGTWWRDRAYVCFTNEQDFQLYVMRWA